MKVNVNLKILTLWYSPVFISVCVPLLLHRTATETVALNEKHRTNLVAIVRRCFCRSEPFYLKCKFSALSFAVFWLVRFVSIFYEQWACKSVQIFDASYTFYNRAEFLPLNIFCIRTSGRYATAVDLSITNFEGGKLN